MFGRACAARSELLNSVNCLSWLVSTGSAELRASKLVLKSPALFEAVVFLPVTSGLVFLRRALAVLQSSWSKVRKRCCKWKGWRRRKRLFVVCLISACFEHLRLKMNGAVKNKFKINGSKQPLNCFCSWSCSLSQPRLKCGKDTLAMTSGCVLLHDLLSLVKIKLYYGKTLVLFITVNMS